MSNQQVNAYPMASRITDATHENSMMANTLGPRRLSDSDLLKLTSDLFLLEGTIGSLAHMSNELGFEQYASIPNGKDSPNTVKHCHSHFVFKSGGKINFGLLQFDGVEWVSENAEKEVSYKNRLAESGTLTIKLRNESGDYSTVTSSRVNALEMTIAISRLGSSIYSALGSFLKEVSSVVYKGDINSEVVSATERAAIMRIQDDRLKNLVDRTSIIKISDGLGRASSQELFSGQQRADDWAVRILAGMSPVVYNWIFKGEALGVPAFKLNSIKG